MPPSTAQTDSRPPLPARELSLRHGEDLAQYPWNRTKYTYDADGNLLSVLEPSSDLTENTYDFENQLIETELPDTTVIVFTYDGFLKRVQRDDGTTITKYLWDDQNVLQETDDSLVVEAVYTVAPQASRYGTLVSQQRDSASSFYQFDAVGSTIQLTDETGVVTDDYVYTAFGDVTGNTGSTENPYQWIGREGYYLDPGTARYNLRRREYQANIARFLQQEPLGLDAGDPNLYRYVENDPVNQTDPSGLQGAASAARPAAIPWEGGGAGGPTFPSQLSPDQAMLIDACAGIVPCLHEVARLLEAIDATVVPRNTPVLRYFFPETFGSHCARWGTRFNEILTELPLDEFGRRIRLHPTELPYPRSGGPQHFITLVVVNGKILAVDNGAFGGADHIFDPITIVGDTSLPLETRQAIADALNGLQPGLVAVEPTP